MYLSYGSWSGGIFLLELDPETGLAIYPGVDSTDRESGNFVDRYFAIQLAAVAMHTGKVLISNMTLKADSIICSSRTEALPRMVVTT